MQRRVGAEWEHAIVIVSMVVWTCFLPSLVVFWLCVCCVVVLGWLSEWRKGKKGNLESWDLSYVFSSIGCLLLPCRQHHHLGDNGENADSHHMSSKKKVPHVKKPLNAFMLFMKEMRAKVIEECALKESAAINQILGRRVSQLGRHV